MHLPPQPSVRPQDDHLDAVYFAPTPPQSPQLTTSQKAFKDLILPSTLSPTSMEELSGHHLHHLIAINLSNGTRMILKINPSPDTVLLRHERYILQSEAAAYATLSKSRLPVPRILKYEHESGHLGAPFLLTSRLDGIKYADVMPSLSHVERSRIDRQLKSIGLAISQHTSPTFGLVGEVASRRRGHRTWREAFTSMVESVIMDGEDTMVNIPYFQIREALSRWDTYLDDVTEARLVVLDFDRPENVLINRKTGEVTGLLDFGMAVWGDPLLASPEGRIDILGLLYSCYRAMVTIVRNNFRAQDDAGELEARKTLTRALSRLAGDL